MKSFAFVFIIICGTAVYGQSSQDEIHRLQQNAIANEKLAREAEIRAVMAEKQEKRMRYLLAANEIADRSIEIREKELASLLAVQAHNFNVNNGGYIYSSKIYDALLNALKKNDFVQNNSEEAKSLLKNSAINKPIFSVLLPNSKRSVVAEQNGNLKFVNEDGITLSILSGHRAQVNQIKFSHSGMLIATSGLDNSIRIWNLRQLNERPIVITEMNTISNLNFSNDDTQLMYLLGGAEVKTQSLDMNVMAAELCKILKRNLTKEEWSWHVGDDLAYESTCSKSSK